MRDVGKLALIKRLAENSGLASHDAENFYLAYEAALRSTFGSFAIGCVIVSAGHVIASGANTTKSDPMQKRYNMLYRAFAEADYCNQEHSIHAEMAAIKSVPYPVKVKTDWSKAEAYVYRISPGKEYGQGLAAPCCACAHALADLGVKTVKFSTEYGFAVSGISSDGVLSR